MSMTIHEKLADAEAQYHALITGTQARVVVDQNGERVEFTAANQGRLMKYINQLKTQISAPVRKNGPINPFF